MARAHLPDSEPSKGDAMKLTHWVDKLFNSKEDTPNREQSRELVAETYATVEEVSKLRENVLENRDFPIASYLRGEPPTAKRRVKK